MKRFIKKHKVLFSAALVGGLLLTTTSCQDTLKDLNQSPDAVITAAPDQILTQAIYKFTPNDYSVWFLQAPAFFSHSQIGITSNGYNSAALSGGAGRQNLLSTNLLGYKYAMQDEISKMDETKAAQYKNIQAALDVLITYLGIYDSDDAGDIPFTEAAQYRYGGTLTPKYDHVRDLYDLWLTNLDACIKAFTENKDQASLSNNDLAYKGDWAKWAKLANSLKLKIAARLIHQDFARAKSIAQEVVSASCGVLNGKDDDLLFKKADESINTGDGSTLDKGDIAYNTGNTTITYHGLAPTQELCKFLIDNEDPRVRFLYTKNDWNSKVVAWFLENGKKASIPSYILENVEIGTTADGKETFKAWKGKGEPWVRYYGLPTAYQAATLTNDGGKTYVYAEYYKWDQMQKDLPGNKTFQPTSTLNEYLIHGRKSFTVPTAPNGKVIQETANRAMYNMYMTTAEVNFYLAEFATYGAISGDANTYFQKAIKSSVEEYDRMAGLNGIPYYGKTYDYDPNESVIDLQNGEIDKLLQKPAYTLTGDKDADLEKIFLQLEIHFNYQPRDMWVTARRSGVPEFNSTLLPRVDFTANNFAPSSIARRASISEILSTDVMKNILEESYKSQGFTAGAIDGKTLNSERVWQDQGAPQWGAGPNVK